jgi:ATP-dependent RNA circularization protein (DNA/RNA ligase family)
MNIRISAYEAPSASMEKVDVTESAVRIKGVSVTVLYRGELEGVVMNDPEITKRKGKMTK